MSSAPANGTVEVTVVAPSYRRLGRLEGLLAALGRQTLEPSRFEVVIVDDDPARGAEQALAGRETPFALRVITSAGGVGPAAARNLGWQAAGAELIAFTDDDCEPGPGWLEALLATHHRDPRAIVQGRTGPIVAELGAYGPFGRTRVVDRPTIYFETCNIGYPRELLERVGGFDETFPEPAGEDADLGWRALEAGAERVFTQDALVSHAVEDVGVRGYLRDARRGPTSMAMMRRHPGLRARATYRNVFWHRNHALALAALAGLLIGTLLAISGSVIAGSIAALVLAVPWLRTLAGRCGASGGPIWHAPVHAAFDAVEIASCIRHAARTRIPIV